MTSFIVALYVFGGSRVEHERTMKTMSLYEVLLAGLGEDSVRQGRQQTRVAEVRPHITTDDGAEEALQRQDVTQLGRP